MANFDAAAGIDRASLNDLLSQYYTSAEKVTPGKNPFDDTIYKTVPLIGEVKVTWKLGVAPTLAFGSPSQADWDAALDSKGNTNAQDKNPLPTAQMVSLNIPDITASYTLKDVSPVGGEAKNVVAYATLAFPAGEVDVNMVGLSIDESGFDAWDKAIFNAVFVPAIFSAVTQMFGVIHIPKLSWEGVTLNPIQISVAGNQLVGASTLTTNPKPLDTRGVTWPTDPIFVVADANLVNAALAVGVKPFVGKTFNDSGDFKGLADWNYHGKIETLTAVVGPLSPLSVSATVSISLNVGGSLTPAGMAIAAVGCALGGALLAA